MLETAFSLLEDFPDFLHGRIFSRDKSRTLVGTEDKPARRDRPAPNCRYGRNIGEAPEPLIIIGDNCGNLRLLEHDLGDEDGIGVASLAPRENAAVLVVPIC